MWAERVEDLVIKYFQVKKDGLQVLSAKGLTEGVTAVVKNSNLYAVEGVMK